jgi:hypothetical protein
MLRMQGQFVHHDPGNRRGAETVEVTLSSSAANVWLMYSSSFINYRSGCQHRHYGWLAKQSPAIYDYRKLPQGPKPQKTASGVSGAWLVSELCVDRKLVGIPLGQYAP